MFDKTLVLDNGTGDIYAGFAEEDDPISVLPNLVGHHKTKGKQMNFGNLADAETYKKLVCDTKSGDLRLSYPMERGIITNWDSMEEVWDYVFTEAVGIKPEECNLLITDAIMNPKPNRERMAQILFERFSFPAMSISHSAILPLYSAGLTTGVVLDCGDGVTQTVPVWGGYPINEAMNRLDFGGRDVSNFLGKQLRERGIETRSLEVLKLIKENSCSVSESSGQIQTETVVFELPDGECIQLGQERQLSPELLFCPSVLEESDKIGVHEMLYKSIMKTNMDIRRDLYGSIVLSGGSTLFPGFVDRLTKEVGSLLPQKAKITVRAAPDRKYATWKGGSVLASLSNFNRLLISKQEFEEVGPSIIHKNK